jgi:chromosome segregation ATPase
MIIFILFYKLNIINHKRTFSTSVLLQVSSKKDELNRLNNEKNKVEKDTRAISENAEEACDDMEDFAGWMQDLTDPLFDHLPEKEKEKMIEEDTWMENFTKEGIEENYRGDNPSQPEMEYTVKNTVTKIISSDANYEYQTKQTDNIIKSLEQQGKEIPSEARDQLKSNLETAEEIRDELYQNKDQLYNNYNKWEDLDKQIKSKLDTIREDDRKLDTSNNKRKTDESISSEVVDKKQKSSLIDDYADASTEMPSYTDPED